MRKITLTLIILLGLTFINNKLRADQLAWITEEQAQKAVEFLKTQKQAILYCACCDNDPKQRVKIKNITYRHPKMGGEVQKGYYQVFVTAKVDGKWQEIALDLAYIHIKKGKKAYCLGKELGFECDPCTEPFAWKKK